jgi:hypothetical protein
METPRDHVLGAVRLAALASLVSGTAPAQCFNIDLGTQHGTPPATYGGAAAQPGFWEQVDPDPIVVKHKLRDISGAQTAANVRFRWPPGSTSGSASASLGVTGDDQLLLEDFWRTAGAYGYTFEVHFKKLEPGTYRVYSYCWEGVSNGTGLWDTNVTLERGHRPRANCGESNWLGHHVLNRTFVTDVTVSVAGRLQIEYETSPYGHVVNGIQLVKINAGCPSVYEVYCDQGAVLGCDSHLVASGRPSASGADAFNIEMLGGAPGLGLFYFGVNGRTSVPWAAGTLQCVQPPVTRLKTNNSTTQASSCASYQRLNFTNWMANHPSRTPPPGTLVQLQAWTNPTGTAKSRLLDALEFTIEP